MRETNEQKTATRSLTTLSGRYRVSQDPEGWPVIAGRYGQIEWYDGVSLAVYTEHPKIITKLLSLPGVRRHQRGDSEARMLFPATAMPLVAKTVKARRKYAPSPAQIRNLANGRASRFQGGSQ